MQACADIVGVPVDVYPSPHATALGAAALAQLSLQPGQTLRDVVPPWTPTATYEPNWSAERTDEFRSSWRTLAAQTHPETHSET
jgi:glycerol kinase